VSGIETRREEQRLLRSLPESLRDLAWDCIAEYGLDRDELGKRIVERFENAVVECYRNAIYRCNSSVGGDYVAIASRLNVGSSLLSKWRRNVVTIGFENLFLAAAAFDVSFDNRLPRGSASVREGLAGAVTYIRREELQENKGTLGQEEMEILHYMFSNLKWWIAARIGDEKELAKQAQAISERVGWQLGMRKSWRYEEIQEIARLWMVPWLIFHLLVPYEWAY